MAELGAVARELPFARALWYYRVLPNYAVSELANAFTNLGGTISGTVTEAGQPVANARMFLFWRPTMQAIGFTRTSSTGAFSFSGLSTNHDDYTVVALDPDSGTQYKDVLFSHLTPV